jgi:mannose-6-phosphate isomerase
VSGSPGIFALDGVVRRYAWGSHTAIPNLLGEAPDGRPAAELWLGAHPADPSYAPAHDQGLDTLIAADPRGLLGAAVAERFDGRLPFLLKVLAAERALSLQVHPNLDQARVGYAAEQARGVPLDAPERNYRDANHKPELLCALTEFAALCGFRPVPRTLEFLAALDVAALRPYRELLVGSDGLRETFTALLTLPARRQSALVADVVAALRGLAVGGGDWAESARIVLLAADDFPDDIGVVVGLLLNAVRLAPGQAIYLGAGNVHAYLRGVGVEVMANSDNVLRCGLTPKHIDVPELLRITDFSPLADAGWPATEVGPGLVRFDTPVPDFRLSVLDLDVAGGTAQLPAGGPSIVLCTSGALTVAGVGIAPGHAVFLPAGLSDLTIHGTGRAFLATVPDATP